MSITEAENIIEAKKMDLWYGTNHTLKNINIFLPKKQSIALIGPSGCGKSTFLKSLNRMNDLVEGCRIEGEITLDGEDIYRDFDVNILRKLVCYALSREVTRSSDLLCRASFMRNITSRNPI